MEKAWVYTVLENENVALAIYNAGESLRSLIAQCTPASNAAFPPAAAVLTVSVCSAVKR